MVKVFRPIPKRAKKVFSGVIFDVYQWRQKMFNGHFETFEILKRSDSVEVIAVTAAGRIIVLEQKQPDKDWFLALPGGRVDRGEKPQSAVLRELREETGYQPKRLKLWRRLNLDHKVYSTIYCYIAYDCEKVGGQKLDSGEKIKVRLFSFKQFLALAKNPSFQHLNLAFNLLKAGLDKKYQKKFQQLLFK